MHIHKPCNYTVRICPAVFWEALLESTQNKSMIHDAWKSYTVSIDSMHDTRYSKKYQPCIFEHGRIAKVMRISLTMHITVQGSSNLRKQPFRRDANVY